MSDFTTTQRHLPHWQLSGSTYFVTFHLLGGTLDEEEVRLVLERVKGGNGRFYELIAVTVMPDHVHIVLSPDGAISLSRITKGIKGASSRDINVKRGRHGNLWQPESYDRIIRDREELRETVKYMLLNAAKRGLVMDPWKYAGWFFNEAICSGLVL